MLMLIILSLEEQPATSIKTTVATEYLQTKMSSRILNQENVEQKIVRDASVMTE